MSIEATRNPDSQLHDSLASKLRELVNIRNQIQALKDSEIEIQEEILELAQDAFPNSSPITPETGDPLQFWVRRHQVRIYRLHAGIEVAIERWPELVSSRDPFEAETEVVR